VHPAPPLPREHLGFNRREKKNKWEGRFGEEEVEEGEEDAEKTKQQEGSPSFSLGVEREREREASAMARFLLGAAAIALLAGVSSLLLMVPFAGQCYCFALLLLPV
jgi:hypothetical protein